MSLIKVSGNASGTGIFTIAAPNSNTDTTFTLPTTSGTVLTNAGPFTASSSASNGAVTIDASSNVGVGTGSPTEKLQVAGSIRVTSNAANFNTTGGQFDWDGTSGTRISGYVSTGSNIQFYTNASGGSVAERIRIDSSGNFLFNKTSTAASSSGICFQSNDTSQFYRGGDGSAIQFFRSSTQVGRIDVSGSATSYVTSSDYRLKEDVQPMAGALAKVAALKPVTYKWKVDGSSGQGFIAHELAEVCPDAVSGTKDAVDEEGEIKPQGIDTSFLVATLTAAIQEQQAIIESLTARIAALEAK